MDCWLAILSVCLLFFFLPYYLFFLNFIYHFGSIYFNFFLSVIIIFFRFNFFICWARFACTVCSPLFAAHVTRQGNTSHHKNTPSMHSSSTEGSPSDPHPQHETANSSSSSNNNNNKSTTNKNNSHHHGTASPRSSNSSHNHTNSHSHSHNHSNRNHSPSSKPGTPSHMSGGTFTELQPVPSVSAVTVTNNGLAGGGNNGQGYTPLPSIQQFSSTYAMTSSRTATK